MVAVALVPLPRAVAVLPGTFALGHTVAIVTSGGDAHGAGVRLESDLRTLGIVARLDPSGERSASIRLVLHRALTRIGSEGYRLDVDRDGATIAANTGAGLFYGVQTLEQLLSDDGRTSHPIPYVRIVDRPEYAWRGLHLDTSRHFFPVSVVERYVDVAARFKLNTFHWHLTDDQAWRIDIPEYPRLVSRNACGASTCDYYSARDLAAVVAYARERHVRIVPEIEGPGHSTAATTALPWLACGAASDGVLCPIERTFGFYDTVFRRLARVFPEPLIHVGGDEVDYAAWRASPGVRALMRANGFTTYAQVQGYFTRRIERIAAKYGRRIVGWNEIDGAGASPRAVVMAWNGATSGASAAARGHDVVLTPSPPLYFDAYQGPPAGEPRAFGGVTTLKAVYGYDPRAAFARRGLRGHLLGAQGNVWSEHIATASHLWYMAYPRTLALAELCWTPRKRMQWSDFAPRAGIALQRLEPLGISFRIPEVGFRFANGTLTIEPFVPNATVHYTLDGSAPSEASPVYRTPLRLRAVRRLVRVAAIATLAGHRPSAPAYFTLKPR
jgi:hexosaminidase